VDTRVALDGHTCCNPASYCRLGNTVPIYELLRRQGVFAPEEVAMLDDVFERVLQALGLADRKDPMTVMVARKLVQLQTTGIRDPKRLQALTVQAFTRQR